MTTPLRRTTTSGQIPRRRRGREADVADLTVRPEVAYGRRRSSRRGMVLARAKEVQTVRRRSSMGHDPPANRFASRRR